MKWYEARYETQSNVDLDPDEDILSVAPICHIQVLEFLFPRVYIVKAVFTCTGLKDVSCHPREDDHSLFNCIIGNKRNYLRSKFLLPNTIIY